jgi:type 1 fimbria pilin
MIPDYADNTYAPLKFGAVHDVFIQATFTDGTGAVSLDSTNSSPGVGIAFDATGDYDITFPKGGWIHVSGAYLDNKDDTPDAADAHVAVPCNISGTAGTGKILILATDDGAVSHPDAGARLFVHLKVGRRV